MLPRLIPGHPRVHLVRRAPVSARRRGRLGRSRPVVRHLPSDVDGSARAARRGRRLRRLIRARARARMGPDVGRRGGRVVRPRRLPVDRRARRTMVVHVRPVIAVNEDGGHHVHAHGDPRIVPVRRVVPDPSAVTPVVAVRIIDGIIVVPDHVDPRLDINELRGLHEHDRRRISNISPAVDASCATGAEEPDQTQHDEERAGNLRCSIRAVHARPNSNHRARARQPRSPRSAANLPRIRRRRPRCTRPFTPPRDSLRASSPTGRCDGPRPFGDHLPAGATPPASFPTVDRGGSGPRGRPPARRAGSARRGGGSGRRPSASGRKGA